MNLIKNQLNFIHIMPFGSLIRSVEKFVCAPAPFQLPSTGFGSKDTTTPNSSATLIKMYRATHNSSPARIPSVGPT